MDQLRYWYLLVVLIAWSCIYAEYVIRVDEFSFTPADEELFVSRGIAVQQSGNRSYLSGHMMLSRQVGFLSMVAVMEMSYPQFPNVRLFDKKLDLCSIIHNSYNNRFVRNIFNSFASFLNTRPSCPLKANFNYTLNRGYVDDRFLPDFLPKCTFSLKLDFHNKTRRMAYLTFKGHIAPVVIMNPSNRSKKQTLSSGNLHHMSGPF